jgi:hypothetical protein
MHAVEPLMRISGLEPLNYQPDAANMRSTFLNIGERCNVAGSILFKKSIIDGNYDKALDIALKQVWCTARGSSPVVCQLALARPCLHQHGHASMHQHGHASMHQHGHASMHQHGHAMPAPAWACHACTSMGMPCLHQHGHASMQTRLSCLALAAGQPGRPRAGSEL